MRPDLTRWPDGDALLDAALALPAEERTAFVREHAPTSELAAALEAVLAEATEDDEFLSAATLDRGTARTDRRVALRRRARARVPR